MTRDKQIDRAKALGRDAADRFAADPRFGGRRPIDEVKENGMGDWGARAWGDDCRRIDLTPDQQTDGNYRVEDDLELRRAYRGGYYDGVDPLSGDPVV